MNNRYSTILRILDKISNKNIGVEVGVWNAELSIYLLDNLNIQKMYLIDPWKKYEKEEYIDSINNHTQQQYDSVYEDVNNKIKKNYSERAEILRGTSEDFINKFEKDTIDFVYLDGNNMYENVLRNLEMWYEKIKKGGIILGNNFIEDGYYVWQKDCHGNEICFGEYAIKSAVRVFSKANNIPHYAPGENQWFIIKI